MPAFQDLIFYLFSAILLISAMRVVTAKNPVHSALYLVLTFFTCSGLWILLEAEFLAIALVLVYVGAVMVLFLFVVMMLDIDTERMRQGFWSYLPIAGTVGILIMIELIAILKNTSVNPKKNMIENTSNTVALGRQLYTDYVIPFELAAVILLIAIVAAIALTLRGRKDSHYVDPAEQIRVKRNDRIRLEKMSSEKE